MSNTTEAKALEVKIRPYPTQMKERPDLNGLSRVLLSSEALVYLGLRSGAPCYIWKVEDGPETKREAIAWPAIEKNLKNAQITKTFQAICGFKLGDDVKISAGPPGDLATAESVILRDITENAPELEEEDFHPWEWTLKKDALRK
jgi:AAA family ATPase